MAAAVAKDPGGGPAAASHGHRHLSNRLRKPLREWGVRGRAGPERQARRGLRACANASANRSAAGGPWRRRAGTQGPRPGKHSPLLHPPHPGTNKTRAGARARGPPRKRQREGQGAWTQGGGEVGAERPGKADKRRHLRGPERPAPFSREAASAPRASGLRHSPSGSSEPVPTHHPPVPSSVTSALSPSWCPRPARPLGATPAATRRRRRRCPPGPAAALCRPAPLPAAPRARSRVGPAPCAPAATAPARGSGGSAETFLPVGRAWAREGARGPKAARTALAAPGGFGGGCRLAQKGPLHSLPGLSSLVRPLLLTGFPLRRPAASRGVGIARLCSGSAQDQAAAPDLEDAEELETR